MNCYNHKLPNHFSLNCYKPGLPFQWSFAALFYKAYQPEVVLVFCMVSSEYVHGIFKHGHNPIDLNN
jgi:hypothetical protein